jgi:ABC-type lipoprotein release transport system permease subunit
MIRSKSNGQANVRELYIFYICLALVLAVAMFGIVSDMITGR